MPIRIRRAYEQPSAGDGTRILVDRLWPRGVSKDEAALDDWLKEIAPSAALRTWYGHDPDRFTEFAERYRTELQQPEQQESLRRLRDIATAGPLTLVTATKQVDISGAEVLRRVLT